MEPTSHKIIFGSSVNMREVESNSVNLVITSPPYPMIEMWDDMFGKMNNEIKDVLMTNRGNIAFELMHKELDRVWTECYRVLKDGGILCVNIGDAVRTIEKDFILFPSHSRIISFCSKLNFSNLPNIIWRKTTNAPNKFMGSGMYPPGAYVTLEHEYILIFRKGKKREFKLNDEKRRRQESAYFWEERNSWFSDVWFGLQGTRQKLEDKKIRNRSAAYPFELAIRLLLMFSIKGDTVLDPFLGTGTTMAAAMFAGRNSIGFEIEKSFLSAINSKIGEVKDLSCRFLRERITGHRDFLESREGIKPAGYSNIFYDIPCISRQERKMKFHTIESVDKKKSSAYLVKYKELTKEEFAEYYTNKLA